MQHISFKLLASLALLLPAALGAPLSTSMQVYRGNQRVGRHGWKPGLSSLLASHDVFDMPSGVLYISVPADPFHLTSIEGLDMLHRVVGAVHHPKEHVHREFSRLVDTFSLPLPDSSNEDLTAFSSGVLSLPDTLHADLQPLVAQLAAASRALEERAHLSLHLDALQDIHREHGAHSDVYREAVRIADQFTKHAVDKMAGRYGSGAHTQVVVSGADEGPRDDVPNYQLCLWTAVVVVIGIVFGAYATSNIEYRNDPLVFMSGSARDMD